MDSWRRARSFYDWCVVVRLEPSPHLQAHLDIISELDHEKLRVVVNPKVYGVLHHPWVGFEDLFHMNDFVVRAEDDLPVSTDILEYFEWAAETYYLDPDIATVLAFTKEDGPADEVIRQERFNPWIWGTWHDRWNDFIRDSWDHDYSTGGGAHSGWDWNLDKRIIPALDKKNLSPRASRVQNIGAYGVHGTPDNLQTSPSYVHERPITVYQER